MNTISTFADIGPFVYNLLVSLILFAPLYFLLNVIYQLRLSPLSSIPGPWYAAISDFWLFSHALRLQQCKTIHSLFAQYGPVVRIGPNKVAFCDLSVTKNVYIAQKFDKSDYYKSLLTNNNDHAMTTLPHSQHLARKRGYIPHYVPTHINLFQPEVHDFTCELVEMLELGGGKRSFECLNLFRHLMVDIMSVTIHGYHHGALRNLSMGIEDPLAVAVYDFPKRGILRSVVPIWAWDFVCKIPNKRLKQLCDSDRIMAEFVSARLYEFRSQITTGKVQDDDERMSLIQRLLKYRPNPASQECMPDQDIISEGMGHTVAGVDTTSITLSYTLWEISRRPDVQKRLHAELDQAMPNSRAIPDISTLYKLPFLTAVIKEALRVYGAAPSLLERVVPTSTSVMNDSFDLLGYGLPPGTVVGTQAWSSHRDSAVFPSPDAFLPDRWLETHTDPSKLTLMHQHLMPFGAGSRLCGGQNMAHLVLRVVIAAVVRNFDIVAPPETNDVSMSARDAFVIFPASMRCNLKFIPRQD